MHIFLFALLLQQTPAPTRVVLPPPSGTVTVQNSSKNLDVPQLKKSGNVTAPALNQNSPEIPYEMGRDIGGQSESIGELKEGLRNLQDKRDKIDRPDIDSLKESRTHVYWLISFIGGACSLLFLVWKAIWQEMIRPRMVNALSDAKKQNLTPSG